MYDNSAGIVLAGTGITLLGHTASLTVIGSIGAVIVAMSLGSWIGGRRSRSRR